MTQSQNAQPKVRWTIFILALLVVIGGLGLIIYQKNQKSALLTATDQSASQTTAGTRQAVKPEMVVDFKKMDKDKSMAQRKAALGIDKSIDMIVTAGDTLKIGDTTIPFEDILAKIHIKGGQIGEGDLGADGTQRELTLTLAEIDQLAADIQSEIAMVKEKLADEQLTSESRSALTEKLNRLQKLSGEFSGYKKINESLNAVQIELQAATNDAQKQALQQQIDALQKQLDDKKQTFISRIKDGNAMGAYGIHVVTPGDNIWNIHFQFLKSYFNKRGITVSPVADEPLRTGTSSGVGKLLKFSENMVHIYNLKTRQIDPDINTIEPLSKVVVFNLGQVFALLETLDYDQINHIEFDGETLWLPAAES